MNINTRLSLVTAAFRSYEDDRAAWDAYCRLKDALKAKSNDIVIPEKIEPDIALFDSLEITNLVSKPEWKPVLAPKVASIPEKQPIDPSKVKLTDRQISILTFLRTALRLDAPVDVAAVGNALSPRLKPSRAKDALEAQTLAPFVIMESAGPVLTADGIAVADYYSSKNRPSS